MKMRYPTLHDLLTESEKKSPFLSIHQTDLDKKVTDLTWQELHGLFNVIEKPDGKFNNITTAAFVIQELTDRAVLKNADLF